MTVCNTLLSVVAIGKNEGRNIERLGRSLARLCDTAGFKVETIYVDSASSDDSVAKAKSYFDCVIVLESSDLLCASGGRAVGVDAAKGEWILFLDGDMELCEEFSTFILSGLIDRAGQKEDVVGYVGDYVHIYPEGRTARTGYGPDRLGVARGFGGASLLRRRAVIAAGNWDASVFAHEELDLYARIRRQGGEIVVLDLPMITHWSTYPSRMKRLLRIFVPSAGLGKLFFGIGQLLRSRVRTLNRGWDVVVVEPYPFILVLGIVVAVLAAGLSPLISILSLMIPAILIVWARSAMALVVYVSWFVQMPFGFNRYVPKYRPAILVVSYQKDRRGDAGAVARPSDVQRSL